MAYDHVARRLPDGTYRIGRLTRSDDGGSIVRWSDDSELTFQTLPMTYVPLEAGTLKYDAFCEPEAFRAQCADDPAGVITRILREAAKPQSRTDVYEQLRGAGLLEEAIPDVWKRGQKTLLKDRHVRRDGKPPRFSWSDEELDEHAALRGYPPAAALVQLVKTKDADAHAALVQAVGRRTDDQVLIAALAAALDAGNPPSEAAIDSALQTPLAMATSEPDLSEAVLAAAEPHLDEAARWLLAAWPRASRAIDVHDYSTDQQTARTQLARAADELLSAPPKDTADYPTAAERLVDRSKPDVPDASRLEALIRTAQGAARYGARGSELIETCLREWMGASDEAARLSLERVDLDGLRRAMLLLPFAKHSLRPRAMVRLAQFQPEEAASPAWWTDVTAEDLLSVADDTLPVRHLLLLDAVRDDIVRPKLTHEVARTRDPRRLFSILSGHADLVRILDPQTVGAALIRVAETNQFTAESLAPLRSAGRVSELQRRLEESQALLDAQARDVETAEEVNAQLREKIDRVESRLRANAQAATSSTEAELQFARMESLRALADALIEIDFLSHAEVGPEVLAERLRTIAKSAGLTPIGESGTEVAYDPRLHDTLGVHHEYGRRLSVGRLGYVLERGDDVVVLRKAQVVGGLDEHAGNHDGAGS